MICNINIFFPFDVATNQNFYFFRYQIMLKCWEENPNDRPTFGKLKNTMKEMERNHRVKHLRIQGLKLLFSFILFFFCLICFLA